VVNLPFDVCLKERAIELPTPPMPAGNYVRAGGNLPLLKRPTPGLDGPLVRPVRALRPR